MRSPSLIPTNHSHEPRLTAGAERLVMKIGPRIDEKTATWFERNFGSRNAGAEFVLDAFPGLYRETLRGLRGRFTAGELSLILDVMNGTMITPQFVGHTIAANIEDGMRLDRLDQKWKTDARGFITKLQNLELFHLAALEIWARAFWEGGYFERGIEDYLQPLLEPA